MWAVMPFSLSFYFSHFLFLSLRPALSSFSFVFAFCCSQPDAKTLDEFKAAVLKIGLGLSLIGGAESSCLLVTESKASAHPLVGHAVSCQASSLHI
jgi:hypothetical protein